MPWAVVGMDPTHDVRAPGIAGVDAHDRRSGLAEGDPQPFPVRAEVEVVCVEADEDPAYDRPGL